MFSRIAKLFFKRPESSDSGLTPEADSFLSAACSELNGKQEVLNREWGFDRYEHWAFDQTTGIFKLEFGDNSVVEADGQILGSYCDKDGTWEWAWNNPNVEPAMARDSGMVRELGKTLDLDYLMLGKIPIPIEEFVSYLSGIGLKATESAGAFQGRVGAILVVMMLKNLRRKLAQAAA